MNEDGILQIDVLDEWLSEKTRLVSVNQVSNALGIINPVKEIIEKVRAKSNAFVFIDGAQAAPHFEIDVQAMDCDFFAFSGHKMYGPTGTGILYGKESVLEQLNPFHGGGEMIDHCTFEKTTYAGLPFRFEAGTPNISGNIALGVAVDFMEKIGRNNIAAHENALLEYRPLNVL
uniref:aminotransferase class V-fold PLP-dependent enzyme n=1 Tax=Sphingobacterium mizutaii TaxID=1010 RepID=UPI001BE49395